MRGQGAAAAAWNAPILLLILAVVFWSGNFIVGRAVDGLVPPVALAFWRWTVALALVLGFGYRQIRADLPALLKAWPIILVLSAFGIAAYNTLVYIGLTSTTALNALLLQSAMPLTILACSFVLFRERPRAVQIAGVLVSIMGVATIACRGNPRIFIEMSLNAGDLWVMAAVLSYAFYSVLLRRRPAVHPHSFLAATFFVGAAMLLPIYIGEYQAGLRIATEPLAFGAIVYSAVFPGFLSYLFYNRGVEMVGANRAGHFMHLMPVFGSVLAIGLLGERPELYHLYGFMLIGIGLLVAMVKYR